MSLNYSLFYPPGTVVYVRPTFQNPRLIVPDNSPARRWQDSDLYLASSWLGRIRRQYCRASILLGQGQYRVEAKDACHLQKFVEEFFKDLAPTVLMVGSISPLRVTAKLSDQEGNILAYLKYREGQAGISRLQREYELLRKLPSELGPAPLKFAKFGRGSALLLEPIPGQRIEPTLVPSISLQQLVQKMSTTATFSSDKHPYYLYLRERVKSQQQRGMEKWFEKLGNRTWPVTIQHGDLASWNVIERQTGQLCPIDWEYGTLTGFPYLDLVFYMQTIALFRFRYSPQKTYETIKAFMVAKQGLNLAEADAIIRLTSYTIFLRDLEDGDIEENVQQWRKALWELPE